MPGDVHHDTEFARLEALQRSAESGLGGFSAGDRLSRDELHLRTGQSEDLSDAVDYAGVRVENPFRDG